MASIFAVSPRDMQRWLNEQLGRNIAKSKVPIAPATPSLNRQVEEIRRLAQASQGRYRAYFTAAGGLDVTV